MSRPSFEEICIKMAHLISERSTCKRAKVGAIIVSSDFRYTYGWGYNSAASGLPHCSSEEPGNCGCIHAEANAIINCVAHRSLEKIVFATTFPCIGCSRMLINLGGIAEIIYDKEYRSNEGKLLFDQVGIPYSRISLEEENK